MACTSLQAILQVLRQCSAACERMTVFKQNSSLFCPLHLLTLWWMCSRGMASALAAETLNDKLDVNGTSFKAASTAAGYGGGSHEVCAAHPGLQRSCRAP